MITIDKLQNAIRFIYTWEGKDIMSPSYKKIREYYQDMYGEIDEQSFDATYRRMYSMPDDVFNQWKEGI